MRILAFITATLLAIVGTVVIAAYDPSANAKASLRSALAEAKAARMPVLVIFGADWCEDCRALDRSMAEARNAALIARTFKVAKVDIGDFDENLDIAKAYGNPIKKGIPAAVLLSPTGAVIYTTRAGELAKARHMSETGIHRFFAGLAEKGNLPALASSRTVPEAP